jgi:subtilisin family serine protease
MKVAEQRGCDIVSMSFGLAGTVAGNYPQAAGQAQLAALQKADIIAVAAASNEGSSSGGSSVFTTGVSPGSLQGVISVASVENTAQPGSLVLLDQDINTPAGPKNTLGEKTSLGFVFCLVKSADKFW